MGEQGRGAGAPGLTDDVLTADRPAGTPRAYLREAVDRLAGADPGLTQLRMGLQAVLGIALGIGLVYVFVRTTGALQLPAGSAPAAVVDAADHALLVVSMLLAGMVAMMASFTVNDRTAGGQLVSTLVLPLPMLAAITAGLAIGPHRVPSLVFLVALMTLAVYVRRWGPRGFAAGLVAFNGGFLGFFLHAQLGLGDLGWLAADLYLGVLASLVVRFGLLRPDLTRTLARMRRSWHARARRLLRQSAALLTEDDPARRAARQLQLRRQLVRLNESTLMIDAQLAEAVPGTAGAQAQLLFDAELSLANCARFAFALADTGADARVRVAAQSALAALLTEDGPAITAATAALRGTSTGQDPRTAVLAARLAASVEEHSTARARLAAPAPEEGDPAGFEPAVALAAGWLPGSLPVSAAASTTPGRGGLLDRAVLPPYLRTSIQIAVAGTLAVVVGDVVSGSRLYWAVLSTFLAFMAATNSGEQLRRAWFRVGGTAVGIVVGDLLVHLTGGRTWVSVVIVLIALFAGIYLIRVNYAFMVIGITVTMSQLYVQLAEFSWHLLLLRLLETAVGVGSVMLTVLLIVPLRPQRVLTAGVLLWTRAVRGLVEGGLGRLTEGTATPLRPLVREADAAYAALVATAAPLRRATFGRNSAQLTELLATSAAVRSYARSFAAQLEQEDADAPAGGSAALAAAAVQLRTSIEAVERRIETGEHGSYVRAAALVEVGAGQLRPRHAARQHALRDLTLLDGALARLAAALDMDVRDHDTTMALRC